MSCQNWENPSQVWFLSSATKGKSAARKSTRRYAASAQPQRKRVLVLLLIVFVSYCWSQSKDTLHLLKHCIKDWIICYWLLLLEFMIFFTPWFNSNAHFQDCFDTDAKNGNCETLLRQIATILIPISHQVDPNINRLFSTEGLIVIWPKTKCENGTEKYLVQLKWFSLYLFVIILHLRGI